MRRTLSLLSILLLATLSCKKEEDSISIENTCSVKNPAQDLPWLRIKIEELASEDSSVHTIYQADFNGETVFIFQTCCINCNIVVPVLNCQGDRICYVGGDGCEDFNDKAKNIRLIGQAKKQICSI